MDSLILFLLDGGVLAKEERSTRSPTVLTARILDRTLPRTLNGQVSAVL